MESYSHEEHKRHAFDSFCKKILKHEARDFCKEMNRQREREVFFSELSAQELETLFTMDEYTSEIISFSVLEFDVEVEDERLGEAIAALPEERRDIILLYYFLGMTDKEIGSKLLGVSTKTVYKLLKDGSLSSLRIGREFRVPKVMLMKYMKVFGPPTPPAT